MKFLIISILTFASFNVFAKGPRLASVCQNLAEAKLPASCVATCENFKDDNETVYVLKITQGNKSVSSPWLSEVDRADSSQKGNFMTIKADHDLANYHLLLNVKLNENEVVSLVVNDIRCN